MKRILLLLSLFAATASASTNLPGPINRSSGGSQCINVNVAGTQTNEICATAAGVTILGTTSGTTPAAGNVGHSFSSDSGVATSSQTVTYAGSTTYTSFGTLTSLPAGNWLIFASDGAFIQTFPSAGITGCDIRLEDTTNSVAIVLQHIVSVATATSGATGNDSSFGVSIVGLYSLSSPANISVQIGVESVSSATGGAYSTRGNGKIWAVQLP